MKKMIFCVIPLLMVLMGCVGTAPGTGSGGLFAGSSKPAGSSGGVDLDAAIREAAAQMGKNLPSGMEVALVSVASSSAQLSEYVISRLEAALVGGRKLVVVDRANLDKIRAEQGFQLSGEVDDNSAKSIGRLLGAGAIVTGAFADLGDVYSLTLKAINIETATVAVSYPADIAKSTRIETLLASGGGAETGTASRPAVQRGGSTAARTGGSAAAQAPAREYKVGDEGPAGGIVFYDIGFYMDGWRYLEAAPQDFPILVKWTNESIGTFATENGVGTGKQNTLYLVSFLSERGETMRAAQVVSVPEYGGYDDWFLPSKDELNLMYENLKKQRIGEFSNKLYWSSSGGLTSGLNWNLVAWQMNFSDGTQKRVSCSADGLVRAIRQF
jgi:hypothetical protein